ncbi:class I SAM-dependent methyltransferase [Shouchella patagoniensis]|uniref:class I SAM-dependent methyltransferase n=1 Tax=Shouchella patagoniensis TaxID=228576 RepID=UPI000994DC2A|nr:class I SAM-dependent methyltransferase [Shouchella patagoniensis]
MGKSAKEQFGAYASAYVTSKKHAKGMDLNLLEQLVKGSEATSLLDVATGGGHVAKKMAPYVKEIVAIDLTPEMLAVAEKHLDESGITNVQFIEAPAEKLPFKESTFDFVVCRIAAHHFMNVAAFIAEAFRVLKPGGRFFLLDNVALEDDACDHFYNELEYKRDGSHKRAYKKSEWLSMVEAVEFEIVQLHVFKKEFDFQDWTGRVQMKEDVKKRLENWIFAQPLELKHALNVEERRNNIIRFKGQSILLEALKP